MDYIEMAYILDDLEEDGQVRLVLDATVYGAYAEWQGLEVEDFEHWKEDAEEAFSGSFSNGEEFAEELYNGIYDLSMPGDLYNYLDWERVWDELLSDDYFESQEYYFRRL